MMAAALVSPNRRMPSSISLSGRSSTSAISRACPSSSVVILRLWRVTTLFTILVDFTRIELRGQNSFMKNEIPPVANLAHLSGLVLEASFGRISPKRRIRKVRQTVWSRKFATGLRLAKSGLRAKDVSTTIVTFTRLLAIRIVARRRSGIPIRRRMASERSESSSSSACWGVIEKYAISLPLTKPEIRSATAAKQRATIWGTPKSWTALRIINDGRGSVSKVGYSVFYYSDSKGTIIFGVIKIFFVGLTKRQKTHNGYRNMHFILKI